MELRERILKTLGQQGALSVRGLTHVLRDVDAPSLERELKTMTRRRLVNEVFTGSYELTSRGRKDYEALVPSRPEPSFTWPLTDEQAGMFGGNEEDDPDDDEGDPARLWADEHDESFEDDYDDDDY